MLKCQSLVSKWTPWFEAPRACGSNLLRRAPAPPAHSDSLVALSAVWEPGDVWRLLHWPPCPGTKPKGTRTTQQFSFHYLLGQLHETSLMGSGLHVLAAESESSTCSPFFTELFVESNFLAPLASTVSPTLLPFHSQKRCDYLVEFIDFIREEKAILMCAQVWPPLVWGWWFDLRPSLFPLCCFF